MKQLIIIPLLAMAVSFKFCTNQKGLDTAETDVEVESEEVELKAINPNAHGFVADNIFFHFKEELLFERHVFHLR